MWSDKYRRRDGCDVQRTVGTLCVSFFVREVFPLPVYAFCNHGFGTAGQLFLYSVGGHSNLINWSANARPLGGPFTDQNNDEVWLFVGPPTHCLLCFTSSKWYAHSRDWGWNGTGHGKTMNKLATNENVVVVVLPAIYRGPVVFIWVGSCSAYSDETEAGSKRTWCMLSGLAIQCFTIHLHSLFCFTPGGYFPEGRSVSWHIIYYPLEFQFPELARAHIPFFI